MKKVIFLMGPGHCGSTLLDLILGSHPDAFSLGELHRIWTSIDTNEQPSKICGVCPGSCNFWNQQVSLPMLKLYFSRKNRLRSLLRKVGQYVLNPYAGLMKWSGKSILIDSSKNPAWIKRQLAFSHRWRGITPYLVYISRDGRAVVNAYHRKYPQRGVEAITLQWKNQIIEMEEFYNQFPADRKLNVSYEELASQPEIVIKSLCEHCSISYEPEMLRYWTHDHHHVFGNGGTRNLIYRYREQFTPPSKELSDRIVASKKHYEHEYYDQVDVAIRLDERWRKEMPPEGLAIFTKIAANTNAPYEYECGVHPSNNDAATK
ncbi:MAG: sulfotransferase family protein [Pseudomonadales bacterium]